MWTIVADVLLTLLSVVGILSLLAVRSYFSGYGGQKGKSLATHEDIERIVDDLRRTTKATEEIKTQISSEVWDRQREWEMKREVLFEASKALARVEERLMATAAALDAGKKHDHLDDPDWMAEWHERLVEWRRTWAAIESVAGMVTVVCSPETAAALLAFRSVAASIANDLAKKDDSTYDTGGQELHRRAREVRIAIRKELGIEAMPRSTESSATEAPAAPSPQ